MAKTNIWLFVAIGVAAYFIFSGGGLGDIFNSSDDTVEDLYPSTLKTAITLNTQDALATTATDVTTDYFVFTSDGKYLKDGTTSSGTASFEVPTGGNYKVLAYYDASAGTASASDFLAVEKSFSTDGDDPTGRAVQTVNLAMTKEGNISLTNIRDPVDLNDISQCKANGVCHFDILFSAYSAKTAVGKPVIKVDVNTTQFTSVEIPGTTPVPCPSRLTVLSGRIPYCFQLANDLKASEGIVMYSGNLYGGASTFVNASKVRFSVIDTQMWKAPDYQTKGYSAFKRVLQNPLSAGDVGHTDSGEDNLTISTD